jgi:predicted DNA binding CopG/RHH family protein
MAAPRRKAVPRFRSEDEERDYWSSHDSTDHLDWSKARSAQLPTLRPTLRTISLRLPEAMIQQLKVLANKRDIPYQSLLKQFVAERLERELARR